MQLTARDCPCRAAPDEPSRAALTAGGMPPQPAPGVARRIVEAAGTALRAPARNRCRSSDSRSIGPAAPLHHGVFARCRRPQTSPCRKTMVSPLRCRLFAAVRASIRSAAMPSPAARCGAGRRGNRERLDAVVATFEPAPVRVDVIELAARRIERQSGDVGQAGVFGLHPLPQSGQARRHARRRAARRFTFRRPRFPDAGAARARPRRPRPIGVPRRCASGDAVHPLNGA